MTKAGVGRSSVLGAALAAGFSAGWLELLPHLFQSRSLPSVELVLPVACTMALWVVVQLAAVGLTAWPARRWFGWSPALTAARFALFSTIGFGVIVLAGRTLTPTTAADLGYLGLAFGAALLVTVLVHFAIRPDTLGGGRRFSQLGRSLPALLLVMVVFARHSEDLGAAMSAATLMAVLASAVATGAAFWLVSRLPIRILEAARLLGLGALLVTGWWFAQPSYPQPAVGAPPQAPKTVILITIDTMRARDLSLYGGVAGTSPNIDALGADGVVFDQAFSAAPLTLGGLGSIMTGVSPLVYRARKTGIGVPAELETLAERMQAAGYFTAAIGQNTGMFPRWGLAQGFLYYDVYPRARFRSMGVRQLERIAPLQSIERANAGDITALGMRLLSSGPQSSLFLWLRYVDPHNPYEAPAEFVDLPKDARRRKLADAFREIRLGEFVPSEVDVAHMKELYRGEVRYTDAAIGRLIAGLKEAGRYDDALIVLTGDHGEEFFEHGGFEHGHNLRDVTLHVPLIVKTPKHRFAGRVSTPVPTLSVMATVLDLVDQPAPTGAGQAGSLAGYFDPAKPAPALEPIVSSGLMYFENRVSLRFNEVKYVRTVTSGDEVVFDLVADPGETQPIPGDAWPGIEGLREAHARQLETASQFRQVAGLSP